MSKNMLSGSGFEVKLLGRGGLEYSESGRTMEIDGEMLTGSVDLVIYRSSVGRWSDGETVDGKEKERILANIEGLLARSGIKTEFE